MSHTSNSHTDIHLPSVPQGIEDPAIYEAFLEVHSALEALLTAFGDVDTGTNAIVDWLEAYVTARKNVVTVTADYTVTSLNGTVRIDSTSNDVTVQLPTAIDISGTRFVVKHTVAANLGKVATFGAESIDNSANDFELYPDESIVLQSDGVGWNII